MLDAHARAAGLGRAEAHLADDGRRMADAWQTRGRRMADAWQTHGRRMADAWQTHGRRVADAWQTRGRRMACAVHMQAPPASGRGHGAYLVGVRLCAAHHDRPGLAQLRDAQVLPRTHSSHSSQQRQCCWLSPGARMASARLAHSLCTARPLVASRGRPRRLAGGAPSPSLGVKARPNV